MYLFVSHYPLALYREQGDKLLAYVVAKGREGTAPLGALHESKGSSSCLATLLFMHQIEIWLAKKQSFLEHLRVPQIASSQNLLTIMQPNIMFYSI